MNMQELVDYLNKTAHAYYVLDKPLISDSEWDRLYDKLLSMEKETGIQLETSPTRRIGGEPLSHFIRHQHLNRLWSMEKAQSIEELNAWFDRVTQAHSKDETLPPLSYCVEYKLDGLLLNLTYEDGKLLQAATRGNGEVGESVLEQARTIQDVPLSIEYKGTVEVYGECIMRLSALHKYNETAEEKLKNARNAAAGALRNLDPKVTASRKLSAYFYGINYIENAPFDNEEGMLNFLVENGFPIVPYFKQSSNKEDIISFVKEINEQRHLLDYMTDGCVIKVCDINTREHLGYTDKFPRWAVAYKFEAQQQTTTLESVSWEVGRTGKLTPLGHVSPLYLSGATVSRATLNNMDDIIRKGLGIGATVWIRRSNEVIPEILGIVDDGMSIEPIIAPTNCPACNTELVQIGANLFCPNREHCPRQSVGRIVHFASKNAMDIAGLSEKTAILLLEELDISRPSQLYSITKEELLCLPSFKEKKADNLLSAIQKSRHTSLDAFIFALGIPNVGRVNARVLAKHFGSLENLQLAGEEELKSIDEIGEIIAANIVDYFSDESSIEEVNALLSAGITIEDNNIDESSLLLSGKKFVVTGTLINFTRNEIQDKIISLGGEAQSQVSKKTDYLIAGENAGSKLTKARELNIPVLSEEDFLSMIDSAPKIDSYTKNEIQTIQNEKKIAKDNEQLSFL